MTRLAQPLSLRRASTQRLEITIASHYPADGHRQVWRQSCHSGFPSHNTCVPPCFLFGVDSYARVGVFWCADSNTNTRPLGCPNVSMAFGFGGGGAAYFTSSNGRVYQPTSTEPCVMLVGSSPGRATPSRSPSPSALPETISASLTVTSTTTASNNGTACSGCGGNSNSGTSSSTWPPGIIAGIIIAGVAATVFAAAIIASCCRQWKAVAIDSDATQAIEVIGSRSVELAAPAGRSASGLTGGTGTSPSSETRHGASVHELISVFSSDTVTVDLTVPSGTQAPRAGNAKVQVVVVPSPLQVAEIVCAGSLHSLATPASAPPPLQTTNIPVAGMPVVVLATAHVFDAACGQLSAPASPSTGSSQRTSRAFTHCVDRDSSESKSGWRHWHGYSVGRSSYTSGGGASTLPVADASRREIGGQRLSSQAASIQTRSSTSGAATVVVPNPMAGPAATALPVPLRLLPQVAVPTSVAHRDRSSSPDSARDKISLSTRDCATDVSTEVTVTLENPLPHAMQVAASAASSAVIVQNPLGLSIAADLKDRSIRVQRLSTMH